MPRIPKGAKTAEVDAYAIESHVPASAIRRVSAEPPIRELAVPGMPVGSPDMEVKGTPPERPTQGGAT